MASRVPDTKQPSTASDEPQKTLNDSQQTLSKAKHGAYVERLIADPADGDSRARLAHARAAHLRLNALYWADTALRTLSPSRGPQERVVGEVMRCWSEAEGAFGAAHGHDAHLLPTLSAIQLLHMHDATALLHPLRPRILQYIHGLRKDGVAYFTGDRWGETDTRFTYCAVSALSLLQDLPSLDAPLSVSSADCETPLDGESSRPTTIKEGIVRWLAQCRNFDGGYGMTPAAETHAAQGGEVWTSLATLAILDQLHTVDGENLAFWLAERQLPNGGLNGRPEKLEDVCYSWWVAASLSILKKLHWINADKLRRFILSAQDPDGGIADRPGDEPDIFHTLFGLAGLSLLGYPELVPIDPVYCMPSEVIRNLGLSKDYQSLNTTLHLTD